MLLRLGRRPINRDRWPGGGGGDGEWAIKGLCRFATVTHSGHYKMDQQENSKSAQRQRQNGTFFLKYFPGKDQGAGKVTASWKVRRAHAGARRSLAAPAPLGAGATRASRAQTPQRRRAPRGPRPALRLRPALYPTNQDGLPAFQFPKPRLEPARSQPMGVRAQRPERAARAEPAQSEKSEPNPSGPPLRTHRLPPPPPPGSGVLSQPESPVLRPGSGERAR